MSPTVIEREILIEAPQEVVWRVVTEPAQISQWFSDEADLDLQPGGEGVLVFGERATSQTVTVALAVESVDPPRRFSFRWAYPEGATAHEGNSLHVEFTLIPEGDKTRLRLVESGFDRIDWPQQQRTDTANEHEKGWDVHLGRLRDYAPGQSQGAVSW
jgi:uncharacterized protein YndB with AHSA1/START domain